ncbi:MAG: PQ-loop domain-containing transporter [Candidatus Aquicultor sp.]
MTEHIYYAVFGYITVAFSLLFKTPQIYLMVTEESRECIPLLATWTEIWSYLLYAIYGYRMNYDFYIWGDSVPTTIQLGVILLLIQYYESKQIKGAYYDIFTSISWFMCIVFFFAVLSSRYVAEDFIYILQVVGVFLYVFTVVYYIILLYTLKFIGTISRWTIFFQMVGSVLKFGFQFFDQRDVYLLAGYAAGAVLCILLSYFVKIYPNKIETEPTLFI